MTIDNDTGLPERTLKALGLPPWGVTPQDIDRVVGDLAVTGRASSTRRDYAHHAGLRSEESALLEPPDVHFGRGPFGKLHVRFGMGARTSGPRPRWVPMLDGLDLVLHWFADDVRGKFPAMLSELTGEENPA